MPSYYSRRWAETRGDCYDTWGESVWWFEAKPDGTVIRQVEVYEDGTVLRYGPEHVEDEFGGLSTSSLDLPAFLGFECTAEAFHEVWTQPDAPGSA